MTLPNFLVIGAPKAATTSLDQYMRQHPQVFLCQKGVRYFSYDGPGSDADCGATSLEAYETFFEGANGEPAIGEVCPRYLGSAVAAERIHRQLPGVRLVASLRNPVDRAYSGYLMQIRNGRERRPLEQCFQPEDGYVEGGFYYPRLRRYFDRFDPAVIKIVLFEDFRADPVAVLRAIFEFLDVDPAFEPDLSVRHNVGGVPKQAWLSRLFHISAVNRHVVPLVPKPLKRLARTARSRNLEKAPPMPADLRARLTDLYRDDIQRVQDLVGRDLSRWMTGARV